MRLVSVRFALALLLGLGVVIATPALGLAAGGHGEDKAAFIDIKRYDLGIYTLVVFGLLFFILAKFAWGPFTEGLRKREQGLLDLRLQAARDRQAAEETRAALQKELADAQDKIRAMLDEARRDADALRTTEREAGVKEAAAERERAKREIEVAKDTALDEIYRTAVDLATNLSAKTLGRQITADDHRKLLDESLAELRQSARRA
jgi:F-type H+-transporting ATPase subunit b